MLDLGGGGGMFFSPCLKKFHFKHEPGTGKRCLAGFKLQSATVSKLKLRKIVTVKNKDIVNTV